MKLKINSDTVIGILTIIWGIFILIHTFSYPKMPLGLSPGDFPRVISFLLIILGIIQIIQSFVLKEEPKKLYSWKNLKNVLILVIIGLIYVYLLHYFGFLYLTPFLIFITLYLFNYRKITPAILISILVTILIHFIFYNIFKVPLPQFSLF